MMSRHILASCDAPSPPDDLIRIRSVNRGLLGPRLSTGQFSDAWCLTPHSPFPCISHARHAPPFSPLFLFPLIPFPAF